MTSELSIFANHFSIYFSTFCVCCVCFHSIFWQRRRHIQQMALYWHMCKGASDWSIWICRHVEIISLVLKWKFAGFTKIKKIVCVCDLEFKKIHLVVVDSTDLRIRCKSLANWRQFLKNYTLDDLSIFLRNVKTNVFYPESVWCLDDIFICHWKIWKWKSNQIQISKD